MLEVEDMKEDTAEVKKRYPYLALCPFFDTPLMPASAEVLKIKYCEHEYEARERYKLKSIGKAIPSHL